MSGERLTSVVVSYFLLGKWFSGGIQEFLVNLSSHGSRVERVAEERMNIKEVFNVSL